MSKKRFGKKSVFVIARSLLLVAMSLGMTIGVSDGVAGLPKKFTLDCVEASCMGGPMGQNKCKALLDLPNWGAYPGMPYTVHYEGSFPFDTQCGYMKCQKLEYFDIKCSFKFHKPGVGYCCGNPSP